MKLESSTRIQSDCEHLSLSHSIDSSWQATCFYCEIHAQLEAATSEEFLNEIPIQWLPGFLLYPLLFFPFVSVTQFAARMISSSIGPQRDHSNIIHLLTAKYFFDCLWIYDTRINSLRRNWLIGHSSFELTVKGQIICFQSSEFLVASRVEQSSRNQRKNKQTREASASRKKLDLNN